ncbi:MAG TPA: hypothetical protein VF761_19245 [Gemmatimonadaceae bacterium]
MALLLLHTDASDLIAILGGMTIVGAVLFPLLRAWARRIEGRVSGQEMLPATDARLARMEHAIEAVAVEVERISEAQRFTTKLLAERTAPAPGAEGRRP